MSSSNSNGVVPSLAELLAEIDKIEREVNDLNRAAQRGEEYVKHMEAMIDRDLKETAKVENNIVSINKEIRDWEERDRFLQNAIDSGFQSSKLLLQMESEAKAKLDHEKNTTNDLYHKLNSQISNFKKKVYDEESKLRQIPEYSSLITAEERIAAKNVELLNGKKKIENLKRQINEIEAGRPSERVSWSSFTKTCVELAENWIKTRNVLRELMNLKEEKAKIDHQVMELEAKSIDVSVQEEETMEESLAEDDGIVKENVSNNILLKTSFPPIVTPSPKKAVLPKFVLAPPILTPTKKAAEVASKSPMKNKLEVALEPPTPRTKSLHLKLGTSLLNLKKSKQAAAAEASPKSSQVQLNCKGPVSLVRGSQVEAMEVEVAEVHTEPATGVDVETPKEDNNVANSSSRGHSRPNSPMRNILNSVFSGSGDQNGNLKLKSFKFGLPTLFPKTSRPKSTEAGAHNIETEPKSTPATNLIPSLKAPFKLQAPLLPESKTSSRPSAETDSAEAKSPAKNPEAAIIRNSSAGKKPSFLSTFRKSPRKEVLSPNSITQVIEKVPSPDVATSFDLGFVSSPSKDDTMDTSKDLFGITSKSPENFSGNFFDSSHNESGGFSAFGGEGNDFFGGERKDDGWKFNGDKDEEGGSGFSFNFGGNNGDEDGEKGFSFNFGGNNGEEDGAKGFSFNFGGNVGEEDGGSFFGKESETTDKPGGSFSFF